MSNPGQQVPGPPGPAGPISRVAGSGVLLPEEPTVDFRTGFAVTDDPVAGHTHVDLDGDLIYRDARPRIGDSLIWDGEGWTPQPGSLAQNISYAWADNPQVIAGGTAPWIKVALDNWEQRLSPATTSPNYQGAWAAGTIYSGPRVAGLPVNFRTADAVIGSDGVYYFSRQNGNQGHDPTADDSETWWWPMISLAPRFDAGRGDLVVVADGIYRCDVTIAFELGAVGAFPIILDVALTDSNPNTGGEVRDRDTFPLRAGAAGDVITKRLSFTDQRFIQADFADHDAFQIWTYNSSNTPLTIPSNGAGPLAGVGVLQTITYLGPTYPLPLG